MDVTLRSRVGRDADVPRRRIESDMGAKYTSGGPAFAFWKVIAVPPKRPSAPSKHMGPQFALCGSHRSPQGAPGQSAQFFKEEL